MVMGALIVAAATPATFAADIPGGKTTNAVLKVVRRLTDGTSEIANDSDWYRVTLEAGGSYAVTALGGFDVLVLNLRDPAGKIVKGITFDPFRGPCYYCGFEVQAATSGTYFVEVKNGSSFAFPDGYEVAVTYDCRGDLLTTCGLRPGRTIKPYLSWGDDVDLVRLQLDKSKAYNISAQSRQFLHLKLLDAKGKILIERQGGYPEYELTTIFGYRPPTSGPYLVSISQDRGGGPIDYTLGLYEVSPKASAAKVAP